MSKQLQIGFEPDKTLENFMEEFFPLDDLLEVGFFGKKTKRNDYKAMAEQWSEYIINQKNA